MQTFPRVASFHEDVSSGTPADYAGGVNIASLALIVDHCIARVGLNTRSARSGKAGDSTGAARRDEPRRHEMPGGAGSSM